MRGTVRRVVVLLLLPLLAVSAEGVPIQESFSVVGSVVADGRVIGSVEGAAAAVDAKDPLEMEVVAEGATLELLRVRSSFSTQRTPYDDEVGGETPLPDETLAKWSFNGTLRFLADPGGGAVLASDDRPFVLRTNASRLLVEPLGARFDHAPDAAFGRMDNVGDHSTTASVRHTALTLSGPVDALGATFLATGGRAVFENGTVLEAAGRHRNEDLSFRDPVTDTGTDTYEAHVLIITAPQVAVTTPCEWSVAAVALEAVLDGRIQWRGVVGDVAVEQDLSDDPDVLEMEGRFSLGGTVASRGTWTVQGDASSVLVDLEPLLAPSTPVVVGGLTFLGLVTVLAAYGRDLLAVAVGRLAHPLQNPARQTILRILHDRQPLTFGQLQESTGFHRGTLRYHLRVLQAAHFLQSIDHAGRGRNATFVLNGGSLLFQAGDLPRHGDPNVVVGEALSATTTHPVRRALYECLLRQGPAPPGALREAVREAGFPVAPSTLSHHLGVLVQSGAIERVADAGRPTYRACLDEVEARRHQYRAYLVRNGWSDAVRWVLESGTVSYQSLLAAMGSEGRPPREAARAIESMCHLAILEPSTSGFRVHPGIASLLRRGAS